MTEARKGTATFVMPEPAAMARAGIHHVEALGPHGEALLRLARSGEFSTAAVTLALSELPPAPDVALELDCHQAHEPHDAFFRIGRSDEAPAPAFLRATLSALQTFLHETPQPDERAAYADLGHALLQVLHELLDQPQPLRPAAPAPRPLQRTADPLRRWLRGHHIFAVLTLGLVRQLHRVVAATAGQAGAAGDAQLADALQRMAALYRASALAFRFTADFDPAVYLDVIRPSMCEPYTPKGFSGTLSSDHGLLVKLLVSSREALAQANARCPQPYAEMRAAIAAVYDDHKWVCARFDGANGPSLRSTSVNSDNTAVDMLERFRTRRIAMLP